MNYFLLLPRPKHCMKNLFIFLPLIFGKKLFIFPVNLQAILAFIIFSIGTSAVYLINDVIDLKYDKCHPKKRNRPLASGRISKKHAVVNAFIFGFLSIVASFALNVRFGWIVILYLIMNFFYSLFLKKVVIIDVFCLGGFFLLRMMAGIVIADVEMSHWIIIMTIFLALFLGFTKRRQEIELHMKDKEMHHLSTLDKYSIHFIDQLIAIVTSSLVVAYMLYTVDERTVAEFSTTHLIYSVPFVYYGIFRYLYLIHKLSIDDDPVQVLFSDRKTLINLVLWILVCVLVIYFRF